MAIPGQGTLPEFVECLGYDSTKGLKPSQERFCHEFVLRNGNATAAYLSAFPGSKPTSANANACRLLKDPRIQQRIKEIKAELQRRYAVNAGSLILFMSKVLHLDRRAFLDENGDPKPADQLDTEAANILDLDFSVNPRTGKQRTVYRVPTRMQAAIELARMMGLHKDRVELTGNSCEPEHSLTALLRDISNSTRDLVDPFHLRDISEEQLEERANNLAQERLKNAGFTIIKQDTEQLL